MPFEAGSESGRPVRPRTQAQEEIWLLGQPPLADYLDFVRDHVEGGASLDPRKLVDDWRRANDRYAALEAEEAGLADAAECLPLPKALRPLAEALLDHPHARASFDRLPTEIRMVEVDRLIVRQTHVARARVDALTARLDGCADPEALFHFCLPIERDDPPVTVRRIGDGRFAFSSPSTDFRPHELKVLPAETLATLESFGPVVHGVAVLVGYGSNLLNVIESDGRMLLHNGYHRAVALRAAGVTHAPAVVQRVTRRDELALVAPQKVIDEPAFYFRAARPPLIKDFFDPEIRTVWPVLRTEKLIEINVDVVESTATWD